MAKHKVYTKTGDAGYTSLIGGTRVPKNDVRVEAYGTLDELNSLLGLLRSTIKSEQLQHDILQIQHFLFDLGALLATDLSKTESQLTSKALKIQIESLESKIDMMDLQLPSLTKFILPGGEDGVAICHFCRTVCRRLERRLYDMKSVFEIDEFVLIYINRLSDFLFVTSRFITFLLGKEDFFWENNCL